MRPPLQIDDDGADDVPSLVGVASALPEWFTPNGLEQMRIDLRFQRVLVAREDDRIAGFLSYFVHEAVAWIGWMAVVPDRHRRGISRALVEHLAAGLAAAGVAEIRIDTLGDSVDYAPYAATRAFWRGVGFEDFARVAQENPEWPEKLTLRRLLRTSHAPVSLARTRRRPSPSPPPARRDI